MVYQNLSDVLWQIAHPKSDYYFDLANGESEKPSDVWFLLVVLLFLFTVSINYFYSFFRWMQILNALPALFCGKPTGQHQLPRSKKDFPHVTIQICTYNEGDVVQETLRRACNLNWPKDKLTIQVLDDSTEEYHMRLVQQAVQECLLEHGFDMTVQRLSRPDRAGYKAGNLAYNFESIVSDFVVYLDEDHHVERNFLTAAMEQFYDKDGQELKHIALVQTPWAYQNETQSLLTQTDALGLDIHHVNEQLGRSESSGVFGFNGTGGVWRKQAIQEAGGWTADSVTEDLDLAYRAVRKGYRFVYLHSQPQALEVPSTMRAHIQQKNRWTKGFFQVLRLAYIPFAKEPNISWYVKLEVLAHLTGGIQYLSIATSLLLYPLLVMYNVDHSSLATLYVIPLLDTFAGGILAAYFKTPVAPSKDGPGGYYQTFWRQSWRIVFVLTHTCLKCGLCLFETKSVFEGLLSNDCTFLTTPKGAAKQDSASAKASSQSKIQKASSNNIIAIAGIIFGIHRMGFLIYRMRYLGIMSFADLIFLFFNSTICFGLFWVNVAFLWEALSLETWFSRGQAERRESGRTSLSEEKDEIPRRRNSSLSLDSLASTASTSSTSSSASSSSTGVLMKKRTRRLGAAAALLYAYTFVFAGMFVRNKVEKPGSFQDTARIAISNVRHQLFFRHEPSCSPGPDEQVQRAPLVVFASARSGSNLMFSMLNQIYSLSAEGGGADLVNLYEPFEPKLGYRNHFVVANALSSQCDDSGLSQLPAVMEDEGFTEEKDAAREDERFTDLIESMVDDSPVLKQWVDINANRRIEPMNFVDFVVGIPASTESSAVAMKVFDNHLGGVTATQTFASSLNRYSGTKVMIIWRRRLIESFVSYEIAMKNDAWTKSNTDNEKLTVDRQRLEKYIKGKHEYYEGVRDLLDRMGLPYEVFEYDCDFGSVEAKSKTVQRLIEALDLEDSVSMDADDIVGALGMKKQSKNPVNTKVANWDEVVSWGYGGDVEDWPDLFAEHSLRKSEDDAVMEEDESW